MRRNTKRLLVILSIVNALWFLPVVLDAPFLRKQQEGRRSTNEVGFQSLSSTTALSSKEQQQQQLRRSTTSLEEQDPPSVTTSASTDKLEFINHHYNNKSEEYHDEPFAATSIETAKASRTSATKRKELTVLMDLSTYRDASFSMFLTKTVERYSSQFTYELEKGKCNGVHVFNYTRCLVATNVIDRIPGCHHAYPNCKVMLISDEYCKHSPTEDQQQVNARLGYDGQQYESSLTKYLPLGPRYDFWDAYQNITVTTTDTATEKRKLAETVPPSSDRKFVFNAIFSQTSRSRKDLAAIIHKQVQNQSNQFPSMVKIADGWTAPGKLASSNATDVLHPMQYAQTLLDSIFTLSPVGHSPECFRLYEAMEAGSIPIIVVNDHHYRHHKCKDPLRRMLEFKAAAVYDDDDDGSSDEASASASASTEMKLPMIILKSWDELYPTLDQLTKNSTALNKRQNMLRLWYKRFMQSMVSDFESLFLDLNG